MAFLIKEKYDKRTLIYISVFGALWGLIEVSLGTVLKSYKIPLSGAILSSIGAIIIAVSAGFYYKKGTVILTGIVAASIKLLYVSHSIFGPFIAILFEALIGELIVRFSRNGLFRSITLGISFCLYSLIHLVISNTFTYGIELYRIYLELTKQLVKSFGLGNTSDILIIIIYVGLFLLSGVIAGIISFFVINKIEKVKSDISNEAAV